MNKSIIRYGSAALAVLLILTFTAGCSIIGSTLGFTTKATPEVRLLADKSSNDAEPTPFQPFLSTPVPTSAPIVITDTLVPNKGYSKPDGQINVLLLGSDWRADSGYRTDVIMLVSFYTKEEKISIVSFPRDLWVSIPGVGEQRINTAQAYGGFPLTQKTFAYNFGTSVDHYMMTNFNGFLSIIDTLGGIEINAAQNLYDRCDLSYSHGGYCSVGPGPVTLDSEMALWYVRSRYTSSDFYRMDRAREVIMGILRKIVSLDGVARAGDIYNTLSSSVVTDLSLSDIVPLITLAAKVMNDSSKITMYEIGESQVTAYVMPSSGANVLLPNYDAIWQILKTALFTP
ncbi:MAG: LCP family protein [Pelolinea sp.]|nr:LCP family protein [Pelolinea sp.]